MSDKKAAYLFGVVFEELALFSGVEGVKKSAAKIYVESLEFDFADIDMNADEALAKLDLCRKSNVQDGPPLEYGPV